jgi:hypothetical protein
MQDGEVLAVGLL